MLDNLIEKIIEDKNNMLDKCTIELLKYAGIKTSDKLSDFEMLMIMDDLESKGYKLKLERINEYREKLCLIKTAGNNNFTEAGFEFILHIDMDKLNIIMNVVPFGGIVQII